MELLPFDAFLELWGCAQAVCLFACVARISNMSHRRHQNWENMFCRLAQQPRTVPEMCLTNTETRMVRNPIWKKCRIWNDKLEAAEWQIGGGAKLALAFFWIDLHRFRQNKSWPYIPLSPKKYTSMGLKCILKAPGASEEKLSALEAFVPPTHFVEWVGEPDYLLPNL